jgi:glycosyltransferase involved in cell wall biosynthesis
MRILVHDYAGHPFEVQLSRALAARGHQVLHLYSESTVTPRGRLSRLPEDPPSFDVKSLSLGRSIEKHAFVRRWLQERAYGRLFAQAIKQYRPDVVLSANTPTDARAQAIGATRAVGAGDVIWLQDIYGLAVDRLLRRKLPLIGALIGARYVRLERRLMRRADRIVAITADFLPTLTEWGIPAERVDVIENWAPLEELPLRPRDNDWGRSHDLVGKTVLMYAGTLGLKHDPTLLLDLARDLLTVSDVRVVVISEGPVVEDLERRAVDLPNIVFLPFQPHGAMPEVLASADVLVILLERCADRFSVPSKALTYFCAGRPILGAMPAGNLATRLIQESGAGVVVEPGDRAAFIAAGRALVSEISRRDELGRNGRSYAERTFNIGLITDRFEAVIAAARRRNQATFPSREAVAADANAGGQSLGREQIQR